MSQLQMELDSIQASNLPPYQHLFFCSSHKSTTTLIEIITAVNHFNNYKKLDPKLPLICKFK